MGKMYQLISNPQELPAPNGWEDFIAGMVSSFDDLGDLERPRFSADANCGGVIFMAGSASLEGFQEALLVLSAFARHQAGGAGESAVATLAGTLGAIAAGGKAQERASPPAWPSASPP